VNRHARGGGGKKKKKGGGGGDKGAELRDLPGLPAFAQADLGGAVVGF
jgi:hypothetical protein